MRPCLWGGFPAFSGKNGSLYLNGFCRQYGLCWTPTCFLGAGILVHGREEVPMWIQPPVKTLGAESLMSFSGGYFTHVATTHCWGKLSTSCVTLPGEDSWKLAVGFLWTLPYVPFPFSDFALYPFMVINHSCEYDYMLSPMYSPSDSLGICYTPFFLFSSLICILAAFRNAKIFVLIANKLEVNLQ